MTDDAARVLFFIHHIRELTCIFLLPNGTSFICVGVEGGVILVAWMTSPNSSLALVPAPINLDYNTRYRVTGFFP